MNHPMSFAGVLFLCVQVGLNAQLNQQVEAHIATVSRGRAALINVIAVNKTTQDKSLSYKLSIVRNEELGKDYDKEDFEDRFVLSPGERQVLKQLLFDAENEPRTIIFVLIYEEGKIIGKDRVVINGLEGEDELKPQIVRSEEIQPKDVVRNDVGFMRGIVVEDTKTKPGRDFYKMFYSLYTQNNINGNRIVKVKEE